MNLLIMRAWVAGGVLSLSAGLSLATELPQKATHSSFPTPNMTQVMLGRDLFYDPILSGNRNIACATCHHPSLGTSDGMSLSIGEGGAGLGTQRSVIAGQEPHDRIPRNAPALWNKGATEFSVLFHDGRVERDDAAPHGIRMPAGRTLDRAVPSPLAAQSLLPILSADEMAGQPGENDIANAVARDDATAAWALLSARVNALPGYRKRFDLLIGADTPLHITDIAAAIGAFETFEFQATDSPFDAFLDGDATALNAAQKRGMALFYGDTGCSGCHAGTFQTDHAFHAIAMPQLGPGKASGAVDHGRQDVTKDPKDGYCFRTPSLRNVELTAPYGHAGAFATLKAIVSHHADPVNSLMTYDRSQAVLHKASFNDWQALDNQAERLDIAAANQLPDMSLTEADIDDIVAFLTSLTDRKAAGGRLGVPETVPSGLPVDR